jgi:molybdopterin-containing oxidoreductase family iron-sulfur binding subunit
VERTGLSEIRTRLNAASGRTYWRGLEELADSPEFREFLHREFPEQASEFVDPAGRRAFLKLMGASLALAGVGACTRQPPEKIVPYVRAPEEVVPGRPLFFATAMSLGGAAIGLLAESHMGRPTKIEGNPDHPASLGATDAFAQASVLDLYDPDRAQTITYLGDVRPWGAFLGAIQAALAVERQSEGAGFRLLTETVTSPTLADQIRALLADLPGARWHQYEPAAPHASRAAARETFGQPVGVVYRVAAADVILALDADFLTCGPAAVRHARDFSARRSVSGEQAAMNRLYAVESTPTGTGAMADHRLSARPSEVEVLARAIAGRLGVDAGAPDVAPDRARWIDAVARDLQAHGGASLVVAGDRQPPVVHALAHAMNHALGNIGPTVAITEPLEQEPVDQIASLRALTDEMRAGRVSLLVIVGGNPVYNAPADLRFADALRQVRLRVRLGLHSDETSELCQWHVPEAHYLEAWSDTRAFDGTCSIVQPVIAPLYGGKTAHELLTALTAQPERSSHDIVRGFWRRAFDGGGFDLQRVRPAPPPTVAAAPDPAFDDAWRRVLHDGVIPGTALREIAAPVPAVSGFSRAPTSGEGLEIIFRPDPTVHDGRFANNGWLQELPKPLTKLTWDNAALVAPSTAERLNLTTGDIVEITYRDRRVAAPVWITPGHARDAVTVHFGYGRRSAGRVGTGIGFDAYALQTSDAPWFGNGAALRKTGSRHALATTQLHHSLEGRNLLRATTIAEYRDHPHVIKEMGEEPPRDLTVYPEWKYEGHAWGMAIDLNACTGCNACMVACQAENNVPVVGKEQVLAQREMHWLRVDRYYAGDLDEPDTYHQPVPCMHCENAPCEVVCPVAATVHSAEGLNDMVYNRCVGTRYCSNNCPYKVRRFNFLLYQDWTTPTLKMARNPDVTVRSRGVMEKCTYCVQRINQARIDAKLEDRAIRDGDIRTACEAACPSQAIVFGDVNDPNSRVSRLRAEERHYGMLSDLNTRPRTTYLAALKNPNPELP